MSDTLLYAAATFGLLFAVVLYRKARAASEGHPNKAIEPLKSIWHDNKQKSANDILRDPKPLLGFDLKAAKPRDYVYVNKTLRYPYYQTMAHQPMEIENWIEISSSYEWYLAEKARVIKEQGTVVLDSLPENDYACQELLETVVDWLPKRYPTLFDRLLSSSHDGIYSHTTKERHEWIKGEAPRGKEALLVVSRLTECDFLMGLERPDGHVYFTGGLVAFPGFYLLSEKIGHSLHDVHSPVPQFNEKLLVSVERTLKRFHPAAPFERSSWEIVDDLDLFRHNIAKLPPGGQVHAKAEDLYLRIDRQAFRKLPKSRGIIFAVHPILYRMGDLCEPAHSKYSPLIPALLCKIHEESTKELIDYKVAPAYWATLKPWLETRTQEMVGKGLIGEKNLTDEGIKAWRDFEPSRQQIL